MRPIETDTLRPYQLDYYSQLQHLEEEQGSFRTLVAIPTGGGKTRLAVTWAINRALARGRKVLWLAHSQYLLDQAYNEFRASLRRTMSEEEARREEADFLLVHSGEGGSSSWEISPWHRLVVCSFQSLLRCPAALDRIGDAVLIIDEAHHTVADSYLNLIQGYAQGKTVLGLTATPIRHKEGETGKLLAFYCDSEKLTCRVHLSTLLRDKLYLVPPLFETVPAPEGEELEKLERLQDQYRTGEEAPGRKLLNRQILAAYLQNQEKYGKTVVAAENTDHVEKELYPLFRDALGEGRVFRVHSALPAWKREDEFKKFQQSPDGVLLNINIMNEGVDVPDIQSVFLARAIESRIAITQIVGRALRQVPQGHEPKKTCAYIVNFAVSSPERKVLFVMPKLTYAMYEARWNEDEGAVKKLDSQEKSIQAASELVKAVRARRAVTTLSAACLAGYYAVAPDDQRELIVPASLRDFRRLERFRGALRGGRSAKFPRRLTFYDGDILELEEAFRAALSGGTVEFVPYDETLLERLKAMTAAAGALHRRAREENLRQSAVLREIRASYARLEPEARSYLELVGIDSSLYTRLMYTELAELQGEEEQG